MRNCAVAVLNPSSRIHKRAEFPRREPRQARWLHSTSIETAGGVRIPRRAPRNTPSLQSRERRRGKDLVLDRCNDGSVAFALVTSLMPGGVVLECGPFHFAIRERLPLKYVGQLVVRFPYERRPEADRADAVLIPDRYRLVSEPGKQVGQLAGNRPVDAQFVDQSPPSPRQHRHVGHNTATRPRRG